MRASVGPRLWDVPTITGILGSLERRGAIRRTSHLDDGRMRLVEMTMQARQQVEASQRRLHRIEKEVMDALSQEDQAEFLRMLGQLQARPDRRHGARQSETS